MPMSPAMFASNLLHIKKRNGEIAPFNGEKIFVALGRAFVEVYGIHTNHDVVRNITRHAIADLEQAFADRRPGVEDVQNVVERVLMEENHFDVAKAYIIYRYEHAKVREVKKQELVQKIETGGLFVTKRSGEREQFSMEKLKASIAHAVRGFEQIINLDAVTNQVRTEIYEDISTKEIARSVVMVLRSFIEHDPAYSYAAARVLLSHNYKTVIGPDSIDFSHLEKQLRDAFVGSIQKGVRMGKLDPRMLTFDLSDLADTLQFERDDQHTYLSAQTLADRYFLRENFETDPIETLQFFWMRVAMGLAIDEADRQTWAKQFYHTMSNLRYVPSTPTLFHAGTNHPQMSSCYLTTVEDDLGHIFKCIGDNAQLAKWSGGIGNDWTNLRGTGALIKGTGVGSQGVIPFLKIANDTTAAINRSGRRRGATCAYLETWHWDIEDFLELRKNTGDERRRTHDMNTANWIPDLFMKRVKNDLDWSLFSPEEVSDLHHLYGSAFEKRYEEYEKRAERGEMKMHRKMKARDLWKKMLVMLFETGHPWITWKDPANLRSPQDHMGIVHNSNLCTEITLNTSADETAVCNLGSLNLERHITADGKLDEALIKQTVRIGMRMLDNVIDANFYPTKEAKESNLRHRPVGLGIMGFQNALYKIDAEFDSDACVAFADKSMEMISYYAILASSELAKERGAYKTYRGSKWDRGVFPVDTLDVLQEERGIAIPVDRTGAMDWTPVREHVKQHGMRNSNCMAMAPTATISNIAATTPTIEPIYKNIYVKANQAGDFTIVNPYLVEDLKTLHLWDAEMLGKIKYNDGRISNISEIPVHIRSKYKEVFEIDPKQLVKVTAYRGKWIDQSQSFNIFYGGRSGKDINDIYLYAWEMGLKTTYYLRTLAASQVEKSTVSTEKYGDTHKRAANAPHEHAAAEAHAAMPAAAISSVGAMANPANAPQQHTASPEFTPAASALEPEIKLCKIADPDCEACQ